MSSSSPPTGAAADDNQPQPASGEDEEEELPTELHVVVNSSESSFAVVSPDKLSVKYPGVRSHGRDVGAVQANKPAPVKGSRWSVYYFEIVVKDAGSGGCVAIGFTKPDSNLCRQPGWEADSIGYHADDGMLYRGRGEGEPFGSTFTTGDIVGAGINYGSDEFFFTKNGEMVGTVRKDIEGALFPTVSLHSQNEEIEVNFGQKRPFAFYIYHSSEGWISMTMALTLELLSAVLEQLGRSTLAGMVLAYSGLLLCGVDILRLARRQKVVWERRGLIPWFYGTRFPLQHELFGSLALYFELSATIWQTLHSTVGYVYASRWNRGNPVRMSVIMVLFGIFVLVAAVVKRFPALFNPVVPRRQHNYYP